MKREDFVAICNKKIKLIRTQYGYNQEKMAHVVGISKKTLVEIEKGRSSLGWSGSVTVCTIFGDSEIVVNAFGGNPLDVILTLAFDGYEPVYPQTMGGKIWWIDIEKQGKYKIQQNVISRHYRILDGENKRICSNFDLSETKKILSEYAKKE